MGIPQILVIFGLMFSIILHVVKDGEQVNYHYDGLLNFIRVSIVFGLLYWGGFWG